MRVRRLLLISGSIGLIVVAGLVGTFFAMPKDKMRAALAAEMARTTGLEVAIDDTPALTAWPIPGLSLGPVQLSQPGGGATVLAAEQAIVRPSLLSLLTGQWQPGHIILIGVSVDIDDAWVRSGGGVPISADLDQLRIRWRGADSPMSVLASGQMLEQDLEAELRIAQPTALLDGALSDLVVYVTWGSDRLTFDGKLALPADAPVPQVTGQLTVSLPFGGSTVADTADMPLPPILAEATDITLAGRVRTSTAEIALQLRASGNLRTRPISGELILAGGAGWFDASPSELTLSLRAGGAASGYLDGTWAPAIGYIGTAGVTVLDLDGLIEWLDLTHPNIPALGSQPRVSGELAWSSDEIALRGGTLRGSGDSFAVEGGLDLSATPVLLSVRATRDQLSLGDQTSPPVLRALAGKLRTVAAGTLAWDIRLDAASVSVGELRASASTLRLRQDPAMTSVRWTARNMFGGAASMTWQLGAGPDARQEVVASLDGLAPERLGLPWIKAPMDVDLQLSLTRDATSWHDATGTAEVAAYGGRLALPDLAQTSVSGQWGRQDTLFSVLTLGLDGLEGAWTGADLRLTGADWAFDGEATISRDGTLDVQLVPGRLPAPSGRSFLVTGTLAQPELVIDAQARVLPMQDVPAQQAAAVNSVEAEATPLGDLSPATDVDLAPAPAALQSAPEPSVSPDAATAPPAGAVPLPRPAPR